MSLDSSITSLGPSPVAASRVGVTDPYRALSTAKTLSADSPQPPGELREAFQDFVGQTLFGSMLASMRKSIGKPAYVHGGRGEEVFQQQLDQKLVENITDASAASLSDPMFELFQLQRMS